MQEEMKNSISISILNDLSVKLNTIKTNHLNRFHEIQLNTEPEDVFTLLLGGHLVDKEQIRTEILGFVNPGGHFTKTYRTLEGHCNKMQTQLDKIEVGGRPKLHAQRKKAQQELQDLLRELNRRVHSSGTICKDCEVQD